MCFTDYINDVHMNDVSMPQSFPSKDGGNARLSTSPPKSGTFWSGLGPLNKKGIAFPNVTWCFSPVLVLTLLND